MSFDEIGYQLCLFSLQPSAGDDIKMGLCEEDHILILKNY